jgi:hypothetical protein
MTSEGVIHVCRIIVFLEFILMTGVPGFSDIAEPCVDSLHLLSCRVECRLAEFSENAESSGRL